MHEYDDKYDTTTVDYLNLRGDKLDNIDSMGINEPFKIVIGNAALSTAGYITINGVTSNVLDYASIPVADLPQWTINQITEFTLTFESSGIQAGKVIGTVTGDVKGDTPGPNGEHRNGALTVQAVAVSHLGQLNTAISNGGVQGVIGRGSPDVEDAMLWESTAFWHWDGKSYDDSAGWRPSL